MSEHRIAQTKMRVKETRLIIEQANLTRLASIAACLARLTRRAEAEDEEKRKPILHTKTALGGVR